MKVSTSQYEFAHGKQPRGKGLWAFGIDGETWFAPGTLSYAEAKKLALAEAAKRNAVRVEVLS